MNSNIRNTDGAGREPIDQAKTFLGRQTDAEIGSQRPKQTESTCQSVVKYVQGSEILRQINSGQLLVVNSRKRSGLILFKKFHAEFAGPGAAVGGCFDIDCQRVVPVGDLSLVHLDTYQERQKAFWTRRHWVRLMEQITENRVPLQRAQMLLTQFEYYFDRQTLAQIPDDVLAGLVGVLPHTIGMVRRQSVIETSQRVVIGNW